MARPRKPENERAPIIQATGVRIPPAMRESLAREAEINGRSLNAEILFRLGQTLHGPAPTGRFAAAMSAALAPAPLSDSERMVLSAFKGLPPDKQYALITLLKR